MITIYKECDCHPLPKFLNVKRFKFADYYQELVAKPFGKCEVHLAREQRGLKETGFYVKAFGALYMVALRREKL